MGNPTKPKIHPLVFPVLILAILSTFIIILAAVVVFVGGLTVYRERLNLLIIGEKTISNEKDKINLLLTLGKYLAFFLFGLSTLIMTLRILTGRGTPASQNDPVVIATLNRIISNTIEQSIVFVGLYAPFLFGQGYDKIEPTQLLALASLFVLSRVVFAFGYLLGAVTKIPSFRSFGFAITLNVNAFLLLQHLGLNPLKLIETHVSPLLKSIL